MSRRRSGRHQSQVDVGDAENEVMSVEEDQDKTEIMGKSANSINLLEVADGTDVHHNSDNDDKDKENEAEDEDAIDAEMCDMQVEGSGTDSMNDTSVDAHGEAESSKRGDLGSEGDTSLNDGGTANDEAVQQELQAAPAEADTSTGSARPTRRAAQEATKRIVAAKAKVNQMILDESEDDAEPRFRTNKKGKGNEKVKIEPISDEDNAKEDEVKPKPKRNKGKGKGKAVKDDQSADESDFESTNPILVQGKEEGKKKKVVLAQAVYWKNIPKWEKGSGSLLMEMPAEIMDNIFGLREELGLAEYVALAGVCKVFRHHLDDDFFQALCLAKGYQPKAHLDVDTRSWVSAPDIDGQKGASCPFSRERKDWRAAPPRKYTYPGNDRKLKQQAEEKPPTHYVPRGERSTWSKAQYTVYKEEKQVGRDDRWTARKLVLNAIAEDITDKVNAKYTWLYHGDRSRSILGKVAGRMHGQPAIQKDEQGLPVVEKMEVEESEQSDGDDESEDEGTRPATSKAKGDPPMHTGSQRSRLHQIVKDDTKAQSSCKDSDPDVRVRNRKRIHVSDCEDDKSKDNDRVKRNHPNRHRDKKKRTHRSAKQWVVPEESDDSADELDYMRKQGLKVTHDYWPSPWRVMAAALVSNDRINKTNAIKIFKVNEAQLLTLKHHLVPNPMNHRQPIQLFQKAAVSALALRAHGGIAKHGELVEEARLKARWRALKRWEREDEARDNGTWVHKKKARSGPHWLYWNLPDPDQCYCEDCYGSRMECDDLR